MRLEFFHDVLCGYCYIASPNLRRLAAEFPELEIIHRGFGLILDSSDYDIDYSSEDAARSMFVKYWKQENGKEHGKFFNFEALEKSDRPLPISLPPLLACEAARKVAGETAYWDVFDELSEAYFSNFEDINDKDVIKKCVESTGIDIGKWESLFDDNSTYISVQDDFMRVSTYGVNIVPFIILDGKTDENHATIGTLSYEELKSFVENAIRKAK